MQLDARVIAAVADGDFVAGSYASGQLAPASAGYRDSLVLLRRTGDRWHRESLPISNSVTAPPEVLRLAPDGGTAFVIERLARRENGATRVAELAPGRKLFAISLPTGAPAKLADTIELGDFPEALDISPDGRTVAVVSNSAGRSHLSLVNFSDSRFDTRQRFELDAFIGGGGDIYASNIAWHPSGRFLAVNLNTRNQVLFLSVGERGNKFFLRPWGEPVEVGRDPFVGRFAPDGRHYITSDWGRDFTATDLEGRLPEQASKLSVVRLAGPDSEAPRHRLVHSASSDLSAEGLAISRDGRYVATVNMRGTPFPEQSPRFHRRASVSLFHFDPESGALKKIADTLFSGVLPEGGVFGPSGKYFLASVFEYRDVGGGDGGGGIEVFEITDSGLRPRGRIPMPHGVHHLDIVPQ